MCDILKSVKSQISEIENVCFSETMEKDEFYEPAEPALLTMPVEIILKICSFLDAKFLQNTFSKICTRFADILADDHIWKYKIHTKLQGYFPALPNLEIWENLQINWSEVCVEMEVEEKKWSNMNQTLQHVVVKDVHFASVDTVLLINRGEICISGGRDRSMALWDVLDIKPQHQTDITSNITEMKPRHIRHDAHAGWVWDLAPDNFENASRIYSASWDNTVKAWDLTSEFTYVQKFQCGMSALSVVAYDNIVMAGLYSKSVLSFDTRVGPEPISSYKAHRGPILALDTFDNLVASISEDKTLAIWDRVAGKLLVNDVKVTTDKAYPVCINWSQSALYIGDSKGTLHLVHPEKYVHIKSHEIWPEPPLTEPCHKITSCHQSSAVLIVCSDRGEIKFFYNSSPPKEFAAITTSTHDVTGLRYLNGNLVIGTCDSALEFWIPNEKFSNM